MIIEPELVRAPKNVAWNILLAFIPVLLASYLSKLPKDLTGKWRRATIAVLGLIWAAFLPNTCYLATEWRHFFYNISRSRIFERAIWDHHAMATFLAALLFYVCFSGAGLIAFFLSIWPLDCIVRSRNRVAAALLRTICFLLCSLGAYIGLVYRFNSWDLIRKHNVHLILDDVSQTFHSTYAIILIIGFSIFLWMLYSCCDLLMDGLKYRKQARE